MRFLKAQASAFLATVIDFSTCLVSYEYIGINYLISSATGNLAGGITSFCLGRNWAFGKGSKKVSNQVARYAIIWFISMLLNSHGLFILVEYARLNYILAKVITSLFVSVVFNYFSHRYFVFK